VLSKRWLNVFAPRQRKHRLKYQCPCVKNSSNPGDASRGGQLSNYGHRGDLVLFKESLQALVHSLFTFSSKVIKMFIMERTFEKRKKIAPTGTRTYVLLETSLMQSHSLNVTGLYLCHKNSSIQRSSTKVNISTPGFCSIFRRNKHSNL
jgi:hypothetical protein